MPERVIEAITTLHPGGASNDFMPRFMAEDGQNRARLKDDVVCKLDREIGSENFSRGAS